MIFMIEQSGTEKPTGLAALARCAGFAMLALFGLLVVAALFVAFTAAAVVGLIFAAAMLVLRIASPGKRKVGAPADGSTVLEGRRTAEGWVVEAEMR
jgi:hypothetical protein